MKVTEINKKTLTEINDEIKSAVADVEKKFGVKIQLKNSRYSSENYTTKIEVAIVENGEVKSKIATDFDRYKKSENIPDEFEVGTRFAIGGTYMILKGYDTKKRKYPIIAENKDKKYKLSVNQLRMADIVDY